MKAKLSWYFYPVHETKPAEWDVQKYIFAVQVSISDTMTQTLWSEKMLFHKVTFFLIFPEYSHYLVNPLLCAMMEMTYAKGQPKCLSIVK